MVTKDKRFTKAIIVETFALFIGTQTSLAHDLANWITYYKFIIEISL